MNKHEKFTAVFRNDTLTIRELVKHLQTNYTQDTVIYLEVFGATSPAKAIYETDHKSLNISPSQDKDKKLVLITSER